MGRDLLADGKPNTIDGVGITYDPFGDMVEQNRSGAYTQIVYTPEGAKLALMSGSTLQKGFVPLAGGVMAVYNSSGLAYYRHSDWIGSSRLASTPARAIYSDGAYAPFGEPYAQTGAGDLSFTGMNQDTVSNLYDFPAREYGIQGRWPSPDPADVSSMHWDDPQTLNRYAYVRNNPLTVTDPTGMDGCDDYDNPCIPGMIGGGSPFGSSIGDASMGGLPGDPTLSYIPGGCMACLPNQDPYNYYIGTDPIAIMNPKSIYDVLNPNIGAQDFVDYTNSVAKMGGLDAWGDVPRDPCVYLNDSGTGFDDKPGPSGHVNPIDPNSSPRECGSTGGRWVPEGLVPLRVDANGNIVTAPATGFKSTWRGNCAVAGAIVGTYGLTIGTMAQAGVVSAPVGWVALGIGAVGFAASWVCL